MAIALVGSRTSNYSSAINTTLTATLTAAQTGNFSLLFVVFQPTGDQLPTVTVSDTSSNTWTLLSSYSAPATTSSDPYTGGVISQVFYSNTATSASSVTVTMTFSAITRKSYQLLTFSGTNGATNSTVDTIRYSTMGDATQALSSTRSVTSGDLIIANHVSHGTSGTLTATSTTTNGTWVPSNTTFSRQGTGATSTASYGNAIAYKIVTGTGNQTTDTSWSTGGSANSYNISLLQIVKILQASSTKTATATGSGTGTATAATKVTQLRLGIHTDFSFGFTNGAGRFYIGAPTISRTATGSGTGAGSAVRKLVAVRTATGTGLGTSNNAIVHGILRTGYGSGGASTGDNATRIVVAKRTATTSGTGSSSAVPNVTKTRVATGLGAGSSTSVETHVLPRVGTSTGEGSSSTARRLVALRTATGSGTGTAATVGARAIRRTGTASGDGTSTSLWIKSHILRLPATDEYPGGLFAHEGQNHRLRSYDRSGRRARNLYKLTDGTYTTVEQRDQGQVAKVYLGSHQIFLTDDEVSELTTAGYGSYIT